MDEHRSKPPAGMMITPMHADHLDSLADLESLAELETYGKAHDLTRITLEVRASNQKAIALYEQMGYEKEGVRPGFYDSPKEDALIYSLYL